MSDIFTGDFTAELKNYFLNNLILILEDHFDLIDDKLWSRVRVETAKQAKEVWAVDAKSNEFLHLSVFLENFEPNSADCQNAVEFKKYLQALKDYLKTLLVESDSAELAAKFLALAESTREINFLLCRFGKQDFAIPLLNVIEITNDRPVHLLPEAQNGLLGVLAYRGEAIPVVDFKYYGLQSERSDRFCYIICETENTRFSLQISETEDVIKIPESELQNAEDQKFLFAVSFVKKFFIQNKKNVMVLELEKLVAS
ncbi:MAG: chemotaxis protein CheW [Bdellovibrio sp.]